MAVQDLARRERRRRRPSDPVRRHRHRHEPDRSRCTVRPPERSRDDEHVRRAGGLVQLQHARRSSTTASRCSPARAPIRSSSICSGSSRSSATATTRRTARNDRSGRADAATRSPTATTSACRGQVRARRTTRAANPGNPTFNGFPAGTAVRARRLRLPHEPCAERPGRHRRRLQRADLRRRSAARDADDRFLQLGHPRLGDGQLVDRIIRGQRTMKNIVIIGIAALAASGSRWQRATAARPRCRAFNTGSSGLATPLPTQPDDADRRIHADRAALASGRQRSVRELQQPQGRPTPSNRTPDRPPIRCKPRSRPRKTLLRPPKTTPGGQSDYGAALQGVLYPNEIRRGPRDTTDKASYLGVETGGATGGKFGGRDIADDVINITSARSFGNTLATLGRAAGRQPGEQLPQHSRTYEDAATPSQASIGGLPVPRAARTEAARGMNAVSRRRSCGSLAAIALAAIAAWPRYVAASCRRRARGGASDAGAGHRRLPGTRQGHRVLGARRRRAPSAATCSARRRCPAQYLQRYRERGDIGDVVRALSTRPSVAVARSRTATSPRRSTLASALRRTAPLPRRAGGHAAHRAVRSRRPRDADPRSVDRPRARAATTMRTHVVERLRHRPNAPRTAALRRSRHAARRATTS